MRMICFLNSLAKQEGHLKPVIFEMEILDNYIKNNSLAFNKEVGIMERQFKGCYGIVMTPFLENGKVDYKSLFGHVDRIAQSSSLDGFVVCGSTGEFSRLSTDENMQLMQCVKDANNGRKRLVCGATAPDTYTTNKYVEYISALGADGMLIAPPYYFSMTDEEIIDFYDDVSKNNTAHIPIVAYNIPQCTSPISVQTFEHLLELDDVKGFKNSWMNLCDMMAMIDLRNKKRADVSMLTGLDICLYPFLSLGGDGLFTAITYLLPDYARVIFDNFGKSSISYDCQMSLIELVNEINCFSFPYGYRLLSEAAGFPLGKSRMSIGGDLSNRSKDSIERMKNIINKLNQFYVK